MPPPAAMMVGAFRVTVAPVGLRSWFRGVTCTALTRVPSCTSLSARALWIRVAPASMAAGSVVTSIDCLALVGQPMPQ